MSEEQVTKHQLSTATKLADLGPHFPIPPRFRDGKISENTSFSFIPWDMEVEEKLADLMESSKTVGQFVSSMMGLLLDQFCGMDFQSKSKEEKVLLINQLEFSNVMYMYIYLRVDELGKELRLDVTCPRCKKLNKDYVADLETLDVEIKSPNIHPRTITYQLVRPITLEDGQIISAIEFDVNKWEYMERVTQEIAKNAAKMKSLMFENAIVHMKVGDQPVKGFHEVKNTLKKLKKVDIEKAMEMVVRNNAGPDMKIGGNCVHCQGEWFRALDWRYDSFFDSSSL